MLLRIVVLVISFITRLRFPRGKSIKNVITDRYGVNTLSSFRRKENLYFKVSKNRLDLSFLIKCKECKVFPNFLNFKTTNNGLRNSRAYSRCKGLLLDEEIRQKRRAQRRLQTEYETTNDQLRAQIRNVDLIHLEHTTEKRFKQKLARIKDTHEAKLLRLRLRTTPNNCIDPDKVLFNLSSRLLTLEEKKVLSKGLNFCVPPKRLDFASYLCPFEKLYRDLKLLPIFDSFTTTRTKTRIQDSAYNALYSYNNNKVNHNLTRAECRILKKLAQDKSIVILKPDKGNGIVILNRADYNNKVMNILRDESKFELSNNQDIYQVVTRLEDKMIRILRKLKINKCISDETFKELAPCGSRPGILYGLPKVHKPNVPIRPIISAIGSFNHKVAKYLVKLLKPLSTNTYTISNTFSFVDELQNLKLGYNNKSLHMASFDVISLFTNIPIDETIAICTNALRNNVFNTNLDELSLKQLLCLCTKESVFLFNEQLYAQKDGVAMGSPLGPLLANTFMCDFEQKALDNCPKHFKPIIYRRYVDDCFTIFRHQSHVKPFLDYLNSRHNSITFTYEDEQNGKLPFLDINIERDVIFRTRLYRKPTFTGLFTHFSSYSPTLYKSGLVKILLYRAYRICDCFKYLDDEIKKITNILLANGFPKQFLDKCVASFLNTLYIQKPRIPTVERKQLFLVLPFTGIHGLQLGKKLKRLIKHNYPMAHLNVIFRPSHRICHFFKFKDSIPTHMRSSVLYQFRCASCSASYIGQTARHLKTRIAEHKGLSPRTGKPVSNPLHSNIREHCLETGHHFKEENFKIINSAKNRFELNIIETLSIKHHSPNLNNQASSTPLFLFG